MKKTAIVGQYGTGPEYVTGQAVKTWFIANWMKRRFGPDQVEIVNTAGWKKRPLRLFLELVGAFARCGNVIILPAQHGVKVFAPLTAVLNVLFRRRIFYIVIGGWLADTLREKKGLRLAVAAFDGVCAETKSLARQLRETGIRHAWYLPNCRDYVEIPPKDLSKALAGDAPLKVCTYSRVTQSKGIEDAVRICRRANEILGREVFHLEVYGVVDPQYREVFEKLCKTEGDVMDYCGVKDQDQAVETMSSQFALLFPTFYEGECFAGTVLDAFLSRTPIIANDWKYNSEVIRSGENGFLYPYRDTEAAAADLVRLYRDPKLYEKIAAGCEKSAKRYASDAVLEHLVKRMM